MDPLFIFGIGVALVGCGAIGTTFNACREILEVPRYPGMLPNSTVFAGMLFIMLVNLGIVAGGLWVALAIAGGAHG